MSPVPKPLRHVARKLAHAPFFTVVSILTLALGIGANTAVFSVVNGVLLEPLPFEDPERLVGIWHTAPGLGFDMVNQSPALHFTYRDDSRVFEDVGMYDATQLSITGLDEPEQVDGMLVTASTPRILGIRPALGRLFTEEDDSSGTPETAVLGHGYWQTRFGGDPGVIGEALRVNGRPREIIGVMPADLQFLDSDPDVFLPFQFDRSRLFVGNFSYQGLGRLQPGATLEQANADVERMIPIGIERYPGGLSQENMESARFGPNVMPLKQVVVGDVGDTLWVLFGTVGLVLLIACANVANLFLVRAEDRQLEVAIRTALGASRWTVARGFLMESVLLALAGGIVGLGLAWGGLRLLLTMAPQGLPRLDEIGIDPVVLLFTLGLSVLAGALFGLVPVLKYGGDLTGPIKEGGRGGSAGRDRHRARNTLVVAQVALALVLMVGAGLMIRSFQALRTVDPGFQDPGEVLTVRLTIPGAEVEEPEQVVQTHEELLRRIGGIPGVESVGASSSVTMDGWDSNDPIYVEGFPVPEGQVPPIRRFKWVSPAYVETMENRLVAGRTFTWDDIHDRADVVVVTENLALEYWDTPSEALGKRVSMFQVGALSGEENPMREIVGVVGDIRDDGVGQEAVATVYWPMIVRHFWDEEIRAQRSMNYAIRSPRLGDPGFLDEVREAIWAVNPNLPLANVRTLERILEQSMGRTSFTLVMLAIASGVALVLGGVGIYGVTSYVVAQRTREIGVRMALGAQEGDVSKLVLHHGLLLAGLGVGAGLLAALGLTRLMSALLYGVDPVDPLTYGGVAVGLAAIALLACYVPARRAARVDPIEALRFD